MRLPRSPKAIAGLIIIAVFALLTLTRPLDRPVRAERQRVRAAQPAPLGRALAGHQQPGRGHLLRAGQRGPGHHGGGLRGRADRDPAVGDHRHHRPGPDPGGGTDEGLSLAANVFLAIPGLPLLIVISSYLLPLGGLNTLLIGVIIAHHGLGLGGPGAARADDVGQATGLEAARGGGEGRLRIMFYEVLPNLLAIVASLFLFTMSVP